MSNAILIFSLGPVQGFIAQARRLSDLDAGSKVLVALSRAAGKAMITQGGSLIFPSDLRGDVPNKLVARVPLKQVEGIAAAAKQAAKAEWQQYVDHARQTLKAKGPAPDKVWTDIWGRQIDTLWEFYWAAAPENGDYHTAYETASRAFDAVKRTRTFPQVTEDGIKDSLSGYRSALRTKTLDARDYWAQMAQRMSPAELKPAGRERLDAIGAVKRWGGLSQGIPSVSHVATREFLEVARSRSPALACYRGTVQNLLGSQLYRVSDDPDWPYDGDLFFLDTLSEERLEASYGVKQPQAGMLRAAQLALRALHGDVGFAPSPYYAVIALDGDGMGEMVSRCKSEAEHRQLSQRIVDFASKVSGIVSKHHGHLVYAGGDDVLALVPLIQALPLAQELEGKFKDTVGGTVSAGIAIAHHLDPLDGVLTAARNAERKAKQVPGKASVCVRVLRRSGETTDVRSPWDAMGDNFADIVEPFQRRALSSRFAYAVAEAAYALPTADGAFEAELRRQLKRHRDPARWDKNGSDWVKNLNEWAKHLPEGTEGLARWLVLARFIAQGGAA